MDWLISLMVLRPSNFTAEYDVPRDQEDRFEHYDDELDDNSNRITQEDNMQKQLEEYKVFGRMTEKEVQLALLMKRVKERYITQEQALEMARVLRLEVRYGYFIDQSCTICYIEIITWV